MDSIGVKFIIGGVIKLGNDSMIFAGPIFLGLVFSLSLFCVFDAAAKI